MAVNALKKGAVDFIEKPFDLEFLKHLIEKLLDATREKRNQVNRRNFNATLLTRLTPREQQVLERIIAGRLKFLRISRQIKCTTVQSLREFFYQSVQKPLQASRPGTAQQMQLPT